MHIIMHMVNLYGECTWQMHLVNAFTECILRIAYRACIVWLYNIHFYSEFYNLRLNYFCRLHLWEINFLVLCTYRWDSCKPLMFIFCLQHSFPFPLTFFSQSMVFNLLSPLLLILIYFLYLLLINISLISFLCHSLLIFHTKPYNILCTIYWKLY